VRRHDLDLTSLVAGGLFVLIGVGYLLGDAGMAELVGRWTVPVLLFGAGLTGLLGWSRRHQPAPEPVAAPDGTLAGTPTGDTEDTEDTADTAGDTGDTGNTAGDTVGGQDPDGRPESSDGGSATRLHHG
jgi:hypothetical protein